MWVEGHHAHRDHGLGFCVFNDLGYTAKNLIAEGHVEKVLILDLDVHQGDGTIDICQGDPHIFTCSIHSESNFPFEKKQGWMDISLPAGIKDEAYLDTCLLYTSPSPRDQRGSRMPSSA